MSLAVAELLVEGADWTPGHLAHKFVTGFHRDPREGYANNFYHFAFTGDVDAVAAIALAAASCCPDYAHDLPAALVGGLENGPYGRDYIIDLDRKLLALVRR
jgi:hypothetical protein